VLPNWAVEMSTAPLSFSEQGTNHGCWKTPLASKKAQKNLQQHMKVGSTLRNSMIMLLSKLQDKRSTNAEVASGL